MHIIVHQGTNQIGGCITEIRTNSTRIIIDMGSELESVEGESEKIELDGLTIGKKNVDAVFFTHYHGDHTGRIIDVLDDIPLYMGGAAKELSIALQEHLLKRDSSKEKLVNLLHKVQTFSAAKTIDIGNISITPFAVDHSAYDAYMFLIEADGKKILHTGDFREHGFKGKGLQTTLEKYVGSVDILITEGTMLSRESKVTSEHDLHIKAKSYLKDYKYVYVLCSSLNIDRIAAFHSALPKEKYMVCDSYQREILNIVEKYGVKRSSLYKFDKCPTYGKNIHDRMIQNGFCMPVRVSDKFKNWMSYFDKENSILLYSMWKGYIEKDENVANFIKDYNWEYLHTSGHATKETLEKVCNTVKPKIGIIPIHTDNAKQMESLNISSKVIYLEDKEKFEF